MVLIQFPDGSYGDININPTTDTVRTLKSNIERTYGPSKLTSKLTFNDTPLSNDDATLSQYNITTNTDHCIIAQMQIYVFFLSQKGGLLDVDLFTSIAEVKVMIESKFYTYNYPSSNQRLIYNGNNLDDNMTLQQCSITDGSNIFVVVRDDTNTPKSIKEGCIQIYIKDNDTIYTLDVQLNDTIHDVKRKIISMECNYMNEMNKMRLSFGEQYLDVDSHTLLDYSVHSECLLHLVMRQGEDISPVVGSSSNEEDFLSGLMNTAAANTTSSSSRPSTATSSVAASSFGGTSRPNSATATTPGRLDDANSITIQFVDTSNSSTVVDINIDKDAPLCDVFSTYSSRENIPLNNLQFMVENLGELPNECALTSTELGISDMDVPTILVTKTGHGDNNSSSSSMVDLTSNFTTNNSKITLILEDSMRNQVQFTVDKNRTQLSEIFNAYSQKTGMPLEHLTFLSDLFGEVPATCPATAADLGMSDGATLMVQVMPGSIIPPSLQEMYNDAQHQQQPAMENSLPDEQRVVNLASDSDGDDVMSVTLLEPGKEPADLGVDFTINRDVTLLPLVYKTYCERRGVSVGSLQFVLGSRRLSSNANETAANIGLVDKNTIYVLHRNPDRSSGTGSGESKMNIWLINLASPLKKDFFRAGPREPFRKVFNTYAQRENTPLKNLRFLYGDRMLHPGGKDTALDLGIRDGSTIHVLTRKKIKKAIEVPQISCNGMENMYETDPNDDSNRVFEPIAQVIGVSGKTVSTFCIASIRITVTCHVALDSHYFRVHISLNTGDYF